MLDPNKRIIDCTAGELVAFLQPIIKDQIEKAFNDKNAKDIRNKVYSISELSKTGLVGKYHRIKTLLQMSKLEQTADGKITGSSVWLYLNNGVITL